MLDRNEFDLAASSPICIGTGLVALDILVNGRIEDTLQLWTGGSCGNVLIILAYMGWLSFPIANLGTDNASEIMLRDMQRWGVKTNLVSRSNRTITPIIVERLTNNGKPPTHEFKFKCPRCGALLPRNRPVPRGLLSEIMNKMPAGQVYYFDRASRFALKVAMTQKSRGALIVFEPHRRGPERLFKACIRIAHIVKYSREQIENLDSQNRIPLEIQTLGEEGLRYRLQTLEAESTGWKNIQAFCISELVDTAGAGDWCTAGIVHILGQKGAARFLEKSNKEVEKALRFGEALAALKCRHEGARGPMYDLSESELKTSTYKIINGKNPDAYIPTNSHNNEGRPLKHICPSCKA